MTLRGADPTEVPVAVDLAALVHGIDLRANAGCMSSPSEGEACAPLFANLGLAFETGTCRDGCAQHVFRWARTPPM